MKVLGKKRIWTVVGLSLFLVAILPIIQQLAPVAVAGQIGHDGIALDPTIGSGINRNYYGYVLAEGEQMDDAITVLNTSNETKTFILFGGGSTLNPDYTLSPTETTPDKQPNTGTWITFEKNRFTLKAHSEAVAKFTIKVPDNADVGDYQGEIYAQEIVPEAQTKGTGVQILTRIGVGVYNIVPGDIKRDLFIKKIGHHVISGRGDNRKLIFRIKFDNQGNVRLTPTIDIKVRGFFGKVGEQMGATYGTIARGQTTTLEGEWVRRAPYFGRFVANFTFHLPAREQVNKDRTKTQLPEIVITKRYVFWVFPLTEILYLLIALFVVYLLRSVWLYYLIVNRLKTKTTIYTVVAGDTLTKIASKMSADPRILAKFNLLRWPYEVKPGEKLLIPVGKLQKSEWQERLQQVLGHRNIIIKAVTHFFSRRNTHEISKRMQGIISTDKNLAAEVVIVDRGDTIEDVAQYAHISIETIIRLNHLRPPYRLRAGQELLIPKLKNKK